MSVALKKDDDPEPNETFTLTLLNPTNAGLADATATGTIVNDDVEFSVVDTSVAEGNTGTTNKPVEVRLSGPSDVSTSVTVATADGSAVAPGDYTAVPPTVLTFAAGTVSRTVDVPIKGDTLDEDNETVLVNLTNATGGATIADPSGVLTISDDDTAVLPVVSIASKTFDETNTGQFNAEFLVTLSTATERTVTVKATSAAGTATAGVGKDYEDRISLLTFAPNDVSESFLLPINGDTLDEDDETFTVTLSEADGATLSPTNATATGTIKDDDPAPTIAISSPTVAEGGKATFNVTLSAASTARSRCTWPRSTAPRPLPATTPPYPTRS